MVVHFLDCYGQVKYEVDFKFKRKIRTWTGILISDHQMSSLANLTRIAQVVVRQLET